MKRYDPQTAPNPADWLQLDEQTRIDLAERHHRAARIDLPNVTAHAVIHAIVENQIALGLEPVLRAMQRLTAEGLSRHDAVHAIGAVVAEHLVEAMQADDSAFAGAAQAQYNAAVERITAKGWHRKYG